MYMSKEVGENKNFSNGNYWILWTPCLTFPIYYSDALCCLLLCSLQHNTFQFFTISSPMSLFRGHVVLPSTISLRKSFYFKNSLYWKLFSPTKRPLSILIYASEYDFKPKELFSVFWRITLFKSYINKFC